MYMFNCIKIKNCNNTFYAKIKKKKFHLKNKT